MYRTARIRTLFALSLVALVAGCGDDEPAVTDFAGVDGILGYVDADTPYVFATLEPLPEDLYEKLEPRTDEILDAYRRILRLSLTEALEEGDLEVEGADADPERLVNLVDRLVSLLSSEGMEGAGMSRESDFALYGVGLLPVMRISLEDVAAFERTLAEFETEAGGEMQTATLGSLEYRYAGDDNVRAVVGVVDDYMVAAVVPAGLSEDGLRRVFGLTRPEQSIASSGKLAAVADTYGYTTGAGLMDIAGIVELFLEAPTGVNAELFSLVDYQPAALSDVCKSEIRAVAGIAPRLVSGYTEISAERMTSNTVLELRSDIAAGVKGFAAPVPGLGHDHGGLVSFGMSVDLQAAREFYQGRLDAMEAEPYECELLAGLQGSVAQGRAMLQQPLPPVAYGLKGFIAVVDDIKGMDIENRQPPTELDMRFLLATDNAPALVAMGSMFSPELAQLNLQPNGEAVRFVSPQMQPPVEEAWVAMTDSSLSLAVGANGESQATSLIEAEAGDPPPVFGMSMDAGRYYEFIGKAAAMRDEGEDESPEMQEAVQDLMNAFADLIDRVSINVVLTDRGVELPAETTLVQ